ncbi:hypothetical protein PR202_gb16896 [Eleusine coracana subsp. coracana]|uniref:Uncharacterized protein n=1 Tax=Eleusine coracana subsp. coracana TaxID=191504 RepID=A0AAV5F1K1_ELECO|nr:hypothetical protein PR202_gb16896 [Eleusine coracana subsp. coracana]
MGTAHFFGPTTGCTALPLLRSPLTYSPGFQDKRRTNVLSERLYLMISGLKIYMASGV